MDIIQLSITYCYFLKVYMLTSLRMYWNSQTACFPGKLSVFKCFGHILGLCSCPAASQRDMMLTWQGNSQREPPMDENEAAQQITFTVTNGLFQG